MQGKTSSQAHRDLPEGTYEREIGREGFSGPSSRLYHKRPPTSWSKIDGPLKPRAFDLNTVAKATDPWSTSVVLANSHLAISFWNSPQSERCVFRNADGDLVLFVHDGEGHFFCDFGHLEVKSGDYVVIPRGTMWFVQHESPLRCLLVEATGASVELPDRGLLGHHAIFDPANLDVPVLDDEFFEQQVVGPVSVLIKKSNEVTTVEYPYCPLDAIGWTGDLAPVRINVRDLLPVNSHRYHLPPSAHATFVSDRFLISTFVPRPFETDESAIKVPFFHNNEDYDEVIFLHDGEFFSRDDVSTGLMTFHPSGITHGPHPKALKRMFEQHRSHTSEYAVMIDSRDPLDVREPSLEIENYYMSWSSKSN